MMPDMTYVQQNRQLALQERAMAQRDDQANRAARQKAFDDAVAQANEILKLDYSKVHLDKDRQEIVGELGRLQTAVGEKLQKQGSLTLEDRMWLSNEKARISNLISMGEDNTDLYAKNMLMANANKDLDITKFDDMATQQAFNSGYEKVKGSGIKERYNFFSTFGPVRKSPDWNPLEFFGTGKGQVPIAEKETGIAGTKGGYRYEFDPAETKNRVLKTLESPYGQAIKKKYEGVIGTSITDNQYADYMTNQASILHKERRGGSQTININMPGNDIPEAPATGQASILPITISKYRPQVINADGVFADYVNEKVAPKEFTFNATVGATFKPFSIPLMRTTEDFTQDSFEPASSGKNSDVDITNIIYVPRNNKKQIADPNARPGEDSIVEEVPYIMGLTKVDKDKVNLYDGNLLTDIGGGEKAIQTFVRLTPENLRKINAYFKTTGGSAAEYWNAKRFRYIDKNTGEYQIVGAHKDKTPQENKKDLEEFFSNVNGNDFFNAITSGRFQIIN